jgi:hypothetical protein
LNISNAIYSIGLKHEHFESKSVKKIYPQRTSRRSHQLPLHGSRELNQLTTNN